MADELLPDQPAEVYLYRLSRDMREILLHLREVTKYMKEAETEVSEKMRRFMMYMHDLHDITYMYTEMGHEPPGYMKREMERCDDRLRQLLEVAHADGGTFDRVRREMAEDGSNKWDHTKRLIAPKEKGNETGKSE